MAYQLFTNMLNGLKTTFLRRSKELLASFPKQTKRPQMSIVIRVAIVVLSAYAGSALASVQFADLPEPSQMLQK